MQLPVPAGGFRFNAFEEGLVGGLVAIGAAIGAVCGGRLSDRFGRRHNILILAAIFFFGALACTFAPNLWVMYVGRIIVGIGVGGASATVSVYLAEIAPQRIRGSLISFDQVMIIFGQFLAYSMNALIVQLGSGPTLTLKEPLPGLNLAVDQPIPLSELKDMVSPDQPWVLVFVAQLAFGSGCGEKYSDEQRQGPSSQSGDISHENQFSH